MPGTGVSHKTHEILQQFLEADIPVIGVEEGRARQSKTVQHGDFTCFVGATTAGVGGAELWINGEAARKLFKVHFDPLQDACVWHVTNRLMASNPARKGSCCQFSLKSGKH